ncbi:hypothetical protein O0L34_g5773 [Tuta absoluta]|nr:hypothetical protein O0L34_g5773 [Tuta absoluta]
MQIIECNFYSISLSKEEVESRYPIHWLVWHNRHEELQIALNARKFTPEDIETPDSRGRTPLLLAVTLGYIECVRILIEAGADVNCEKDGWTAVQEATATGDPELLALVLSRRDFQRHVVRSAGIPDLLRRLSLAPDFYVEMKWEFTSWVPLVSRVCPFDTYKVYKRGGNVRVDTTLVGFENNKWQRGDRTYIFRGQGQQASLMELDHELSTSWTEYIEPVEAEREWPPPSKNSINARLGAPIAINYLDTDKICFERNKCGIWGWRQDKTENVNGYECRVFSANNVELVSKTRSEHLPKGLKKSVPKAPFAGLLALADKDEPTEPLVSPEDSPQSSRSREDLSPPLSWEEYFSEAPLEKDIGRPRDIATKVQKFKATLWLCEDYPLQLQEQIMPILDLMAAISSPHFAKLKDFIQMQLPAGFPVKIEIPLFHVLNARITFGNIFATETPVPHIECIPEGDRLACIVDDACFLIGRGYRDAAAPDERLSSDEEEGLLQYAIQQSLMEAGTHEDQVDVWEALRGAPPSTPHSPPSPRTPRPASPLAAPPLPPDTHHHHEERLLQRAIEASLASLHMTSPPQDREEEYESETDRELAAALALSAREQERIEQELANEQRALDEALRLSLLDK